MFSLKKERLAYLPENPGCGSDGSVRRLAYDPAKGGYAIVDEHGRTDIVQTMALMILWELNTATKKELGTEEKIAEYALQEAYVRIANANENVRAKIDAARSGYHSGSLPPIWFLDAS